MEKLCPSFLKIALEKAAVFSGVGRDTNQLLRGTSEMDIT